MKLTKKPTEIIKCGMCRAEFEIGMDDIGVHKSDASPCVVTCTQCKSTIDCYDAMIKLERLGGNTQV